MTEDINSPGPHSVGERLGTLTEEQTLDFLARAVNEYGPDYVDPNSGGCLNVYLGEHGSTTARCIAAQVLSYWGVPDEALFHCDSHGESSVVGTVNELNLTVSTIAMRMLKVAQAAQDGGAPWGAALHAARVSRS